MGSWTMNSTRSSNPSRVRSRRIIVGESTETEGRNAPVGHEILLVEDNPADVDLFRLALEEADTSVGLHVARTGNAAISLLDDRSELDDGSSIDLVVLDLQLPDKSGLEVLEETKREGPTETTPIVVLSTSSAPSEIQAAYDLGANAYLIKRADFEETVALVKALISFWLTTAELP